MTVEFEVAETFLVSPEKLYNAWLDSRLHAEMTGGAAEVSAEVGGEFTAWDGYITGTNLVLTPPSRIVQSWRTAEFEPDESDSRLEILFEPHGLGTRVVIIHTNLPAHGMQYQQGWVDNYFEPMKRYFERGHKKVVR